MRRARSSAPIENPEQRCATLCRAGSSPIGEAPNKNPWRSRCKRQMVEWQRACVAMNSQWHARDPLESAGRQSRLSKDSGGFGRPAFRPWPGYVAGAVAGKNSAMMATVLATATTMTVLGIVMTGIANGEWAITAIASLGAARSGAGTATRTPCWPPCWECEAALATGSDSLVLLVPAAPMSQTEMTRLAAACAVAYNLAPSGAVSPNSEVSRKVHPVNQSSVVAALLEFQPSQPRLPSISLAGKS